VVAVCAKGPGAISCGESSRDDPGEGPDPLE
jgi:hypothetical protein